HAFDDGKGISFHQDAVFERARLGFVGVANDIVPAIRVLFQNLALKMQRLPFFCSGKGRAAATEEPGNSYFADYTLRAQLKSFLQTFVAGKAAVIVEACRIGSCDAPEQPQFRGLRAGLGYRALRVKLVRLGRQAIDNRVLYQ